MTEYKEGRRRFVLRLARFAGGAIAATALGAKFYPGSEFANAIGSAIIPPYVGPKTIRADSEHVTDYTVSETEAFQNVERYLGVGLAVLFKQGYAVQNEYGTNPLGWYFNTSLSNGQKLVCIR